MKLLPIMTAAAMVAPMPTGIVETPPDDLPVVVMEPPKPVERKFLRVNPDGSFNAHTSFFSLPMNEQVREISHISSDVRKKIEACKAEIGEPTTVKFPTNSASQGEIELNCKGGDFDKCNVGFFFDRRKEDFRQDSIAFGCTDGENTFVLAFMSESSFCGPAYCQKEVAAYSHNDFPLVATDIIEYNRSGFETLATSVSREEIPSVIFNPKTHADVAHMINMSGLRIEK